MTKQSLIKSKPFAEAIARLLHPFAEVVIHDLDKDEIQAIYNPLSRREIGDRSYLNSIDLDASESIIGPYEKTNWDGRPMKSISIVIRNEKDKAEGFLCINLDTSSFESTHKLLEAFLGKRISENDNSQDLFKNDLYERINLYVQSYCRDHQVSPEALSKDEKQEIIHALLSDGAFKERNAASYVARVLRVSRATVYNYIKDKS
ncbi:MAG: hypothetical protein CMO81_02965 [Waddliaceae bacterium]|nr:hypothetical protein [Waddliaceae bacterium]